MPVKIKCMYVNSLLHCTKEKKQAQLTNYDTIVKLKNVFTYVPSIY